MGRNGRSRDGRATKTAWWAAAALAVTLLAAGCGDDDGTATAAPTGDRGSPDLLDRVPEPGEAQPEGTLEFAGPSVGGPNVALLSAPDGELVIYACDGVSYGELFEGALDADDTEVTLEGTDGGVVRLDLSGDLPAGVLQIDGASHPFVLASADDPVESAGFYRHVDGDTVRAWVVTGDGSVTGIEKQGAEVVGGVDGSLGSGDVVEQGFPPPAEPSETPLLFKKRKCAKLGQDLAVLDNAAVDLFEDHPDAADEILDFMQPLREQFDRLGCSLDFIEVPDFGSPPPGSVGSLNK